MWALRTLEDMLALAGLEVPGARCVVIGDSERHVVGAQAHAVQAPCVPLHHPLACAPRNVPQPAQAVTSNDAVHMDIFSRHASTSVSLQG